jgi:uncharacterized protein (TIGR03083 family)
MTGNEASVMRFARAERADLAELLAALSPQQWEMPSLCVGWRVRDVVAHVVSYEELGGRALFARFAKGRFRGDAVNEIGVSEYNTRSLDELLALLNAHLDPRGLTAKFGGRIALVDGMIHQQDIRRVVDLPRRIPADRLRAALRFALPAPPVGALRRTRGLRLVATDVDWSAGLGPEVRGPGEAVLLAMAGRRAALPELSGDGVSTLDRRMTGSPSAPVQ